MSINRELEVSVEEEGELLFPEDFVFPTPEASLVSLERIPTPQENYQQVLSFLQKDHPVSALRTLVRQLDQVLYGTMTELTSEMKTLEARVASKTGPVVGKDVMKQMYIVTDTGKKVDTRVNDSYLEQIFGEEFRGFMEEFREIDRLISTLYTSNEKSEVVVDPVFSSEEAKSIALLAEQQRIIGEERLTTQHDVYFSWLQIFAKGF
jgi:hypothetical protein